jgi:hypothetical protein
MFLSLDDPRELRFLIEKVDGLLPLLEPSFFLSSFCLLYFLSYLYISISSGGTSINVKFSNPANMFLFAFIMTEFKF